MASGTARSLYLKRLRQMLGRRPRDVAPPIAPPLPPGRVVHLAGRGEVFVRDLDGPGDRLPLLLLHGWTASADLNWYGVFDGFSGDRRVVAIDHRGHGRGMRSPHPFTFEDCADDAAALLDALSLDRAIVVGYSMGGPIALTLAQRHPDRVAGLVLAATALQFSGTWSERLRWRGLALLEVGARAGLGDRIVAKLAHDLGRVDEAFAPYSSWLAGEFTRTHPRALRQAGRQLSRFDARRLAADLALPASVVITGSDSLVPVERQHALASVLRASVYRLDEADHDLPVTDVKAFSQALIDGVRSVDPGGADQSGLSDTGVAATG